MDPVCTGAGQFTLDKFDVGGTLLFPTSGSRGGRQTESKKTAVTAKMLIFFIEFISLKKAAALLWILARPVNVKET